MTFPGCTTFPAPVLILFTKTKPRSTEQNANWQERNENADQAKRPGCNFLAFHQASEEISGLTCSINTAAAFCSKLSCRQAAVERSGKLLSPLLRAGMDRL